MISSKHSKSQNIFLQFTLTLSKLLLHQSLRCIPRHRWHRVLIEVLNVLEILFIPPRPLCSPTFLLYRWIIHDVLHGTEDALHDFDGEMTKLAASEQ